MKIYEKAALELYRILILVSVVFLYLKLSGQIDWRWGLVFAPVWIPPITLGIFIILTEGWKDLKRLLRGDS